jgi:hypothetical protein
VSCHSFCLKLRLTRSNLGKICRPRFVSEFLGITFFWIRKDYYAQDNHNQFPVSFKL